MCNVKVDKTHEPIAPETAASAADVKAKDTTGDLAKKESQSGNAPASGGKQDHGKKSGKGKKGKKKGKKH
ncbi:unnamed protein product [Ambrosiozyma monospora]|uniref:Unnamed protein product n=1 Tax=Ambrosiozyma monospora TaxID=43982 RepID=A0ACB5UDQ4_AMBMO|nr:unnamed protein product [Ambrosiozyma monospora]